MIREMNRNSVDVDEVMNIWLHSTIEAHPFIEAAYWNGSFKVVRDTYLPQSDTFVFEEAGTAKGFISILENEFIGALFVELESQGKGIGKQLMEYALLKYKKLKLAVYVENESAVRFYRHMGFEIVTEQKNEETGVAEYIMSLTVNA